MFPLPDLFDEFVNLSNGLVPIGPESVVALPNLLSLVFIGEELWHSVGTRPDSVHNVGVWVFITLTRPCQTNLPMLQ